ncbi:MAG TPA: DUF1858 domain-containing protein [Caldisericia bacterium]|nr:DUF1858 domain-containing protein [Caldisericia bacterium]HPF48601.1 DUF1858 domain-containing protein [Caldisericia bacterium]HPI83739.1 DUF1858 domain-containing protein [Caldisericia bacterium]HPQ93056.1 DUF1858 domain-containing protein [Caldisericia bacterium]HRV75111.1 DUF1858 domain-containing protein [Caldisericia bacterium]
MSDNNVITADMTLGDVIKKWPVSAEIFFKFGLHCIGCHISAYESIEDGAKAHGIDPVELVKALNEAINKSPETSKDN